MAAIIRSELEHMGVRTFFFAAYVPAFLEYTISLFTDTVLEFILEEDDENDDVPKTWSTTCREIV